MADIKLDILKNLLNEQPDITFYEAAHLIGKKDEQALYHFVKQQTGHPPSRLRMGKN